MTVHKTERVWQGMPITLALFKREASQRDQKSKVLLSYIVSGL